MQPRPQGEVGESGLSISDGQQLCQDECKKQLFCSNCNVSYKVLSDVLAVTTEQHYCFAVSSTWPMFFFINRSLSIVIDISCEVSSPNNPLPFYDTCTSFKEPTCRVKLK